MRRVRARALGLFFIFGLGASGCAHRPDPHALAAQLDARGRTGLYTWLLEHDPSALVAWQVAPERLAPLAPDAHPIVAAGPHPCAEAASHHAVLVLVARAATRAGRAERDRALDCGIALFSDAGGLAIAPR